nr:recombinase family protein [Micromonospora sp. DSM 115978]
MPGLHRALGLPDPSSLRAGAMKPVIHGYLRISPGVRDGSVREMELALRTWAEREGFCFSAIFHDDDTTPTRPALNELTEVASRSDARHVVMPSLTHLSTHPALQQQLLEGLRRTGVWVHVLREGLLP